MSIVEINSVLKAGSFENPKAFTVHAAYSLQSGQHITIFYNDRCNLATLGAVCSHLRKLPTKRFVHATELVELYNPKNPDDPLIGAKLEILTADGNFVDKALMDTLAEFNANNSWRQHLADEGEEQFTSKFHITLGLKSEVDMKELEREHGTWVFVIEKKYFKIHQDQTKVFFE
jgi:hypothetical protein